MPDEFDFIRWVRSRTPATVGIPVGPGDDCAVIDSPTGPLLVTTDVLTEGVDFFLAESGYRAVGRKAMAVNLSDIAAMAGTPLAAVVGIVFPLAPGERDCVSSLVPPSPGGRGVKGDGDCLPPPLVEGRSPRSGGTGDSPTQSKSPLPVASQPTSPQRGEVFQTASVGENTESEPFPNSPSPLTPLPPGEGGISEDTIPEQLHLGLREVADAFGCPIVGGDTNSWAGGLVVSVTVLGKMKPGRKPVLRSGAMPGDRIFVTGPCGGSILGRHLSPTPRLREADVLADFVDLHAMIDISDGLAKDLSHILEESGYGAVLVAERIPIHPDAVELAETSGNTPLFHALGDGEDFELIFTVSEADAEKLRQASPVPVFEIGECVEGGLWIEENGARTPLAATGWSHRVG